MHPLPRPIVSDVMSVLFLQCSLGSFFTLVVQLICVALFDVCYLACGQLVLHQSVTVLSPSLLCGQLSIHAPCSPVDMPLSAPAALLFGMSPLSTRLPHVLP